MLILSSRNRCRRALRESISTPASEMNEPGMRSPAGIARSQEPAWSLVSWLAVLAAQNGVCSLPGDPGSYQALTCRSGGCDSGGLTHRCHQRLHKATRGDRHPASCNAYQVAGECDGIIRRPGAWDNPPGATLVPPVPLSAAFLFTCFAFRTRACLFVGAAFRCLAGRARRQCFCAAARCAGSRLLRSVPAR